VTRKKPRSISIRSLAGLEEAIMSYKAKYDASTAQVASQQTKQVVNQNVTTSENDVKAARKQEAQRQQQGKPPARTP
jgi:preprotein translocase subunit SecD